jgi:hypothetical protein
MRDEEFPPTHPAGETPAPQNEPGDLEWFVMVVPDHLRQSA